MHKSIACAMLLTVTGTNWLPQARAAEPVDGYAAEVSRDKPTAWWRFDSPRAPFTSRGTEGLPATPTQSVQLGAAGPRPRFYPLFAPTNRSVGLSGSDHLVVADPGNNSPLDFTNGDAITLEAWVQLNRITSDQNIYVIGKGRTNNKGQKPENQNWALRLSGRQGTARISFLFRNAGNRASVRGDYHRWIASSGFQPGQAWHHIAVSYVFGKPDSLRGYLDGEPVAGTWDLGGKTTEPPVVDNDEVWIGSSLGGNTATTLPGRIDEVAIYRKTVAPERMAARFQSTRPDPRLVEIPDSKLPAGEVLVELLEGVPAKTSWDFPRTRPVERWTQRSAGWVGLPRRYSTDGLIIDRPAPFLLRARTRVHLAPGKYQFVLRARNAARLSIDGRLVASTGFLSRNASGHEAVPAKVKSGRSDLVDLSPGHNQALVDIHFKSDASKDHLVLLESFVGGAGVRTELGELLVGFARQGQPFRLLSPDTTRSTGLSETEWDRYVVAFEKHLAVHNDQRRRSSDPLEQEYWQRRHRLAREMVQPLPLPGTDASLAAVDRWLKAAGATGSDEPIADDHTFFRRLVLDTTGVVPTLTEIDWFSRRPAASRRQDAISRFLADPRWADHWTGYWQDVLAENPGILKPKLNNTGPFRFWIHESFRDNKPIDRFVTELVLMKGSRYGGGPAGFAMATQNDAPMAAKAHVLGTAFLGIQLKCARCHDAPYHPFRQEQLFNLAAMLNRRPLKLPKSSTLPGGPPSADSLVKVTLKPGDSIEPTWPFIELARGDLPREIQKDRGDARERLATLVTSPANHRFPRAVVNRLWKRYLGWGFVDSVDDWHDQKPVYPLLLDYLGRELVRSGYDLKHVARMIFSSRAYQRRSRPASSQADAVRRPAAPIRRRLTAEQIVDSLFVVSGKSMRTEYLTLDPEGRRGSNTFLNLGVPRRSWEFVALSNERDRPALALPAAQSVVDVLLAFGWRASRPHPTTLRDGTTTVLQPLALANSSASHRTVVLSDDHILTDLLLTDVSLPELANRLYLHILSRPATPEESDEIVGFLTPGYSRRRVAGAKRHPPTSRRLTRVSWSNHLHPEATRLKLALENRVRAGDPPTERLSADWRERAEDVIWALVNSPEFVFSP
ncbi:MAG TPA: hypothetical protein DIC23_04115 [Planctomycetaceae bacterium]|nr:hypothetical protein [Planctomycetaceae bacterium]